MTTTSAEKEAERRYPDQPRVHEENPRMVTGCGAERTAFIAGWRERDDEVEELREALGRIVDWSEAYPLDIFPEPDLKRAHDVLKAHGMTIDSISASAMRHVVQRVGKIARKALEADDVRIARQRAAQCAVLDEPRDEYQDKWDDCCDELERTVRERDEAVASRDSYLKYTQPAVLLRAETAEHERDRYRVLAEGERERCAQVAKHWSIGVAERIRALPSPSLPEAETAERERDEALAKVGRVDPEIIKWAEMLRLMRERDEAQSEAGNLHADMETSALRMAATSSERDEARAEVERLTRERDAVLAVLERLLSSCGERIWTGDGDASQLVAPSRAIYKQAQALVDRLSGEEK